jgi:hypothetical protein
VKVALGERGPVWWDDGGPDLNRRMVINTPYREWFDAMVGFESDSRSNALIGPRQESTL